jgi:hypothetical protein
VLPTTAVPPIVSEDPVHIAVSLITAAAGSGFTVMVTEFDFTQPLLSVSVSVYIVVVDGFTVGLAEVEVNPEGELLHEYVLFDTAVAPIALELPLQMAVFEITAAAGSGFTVMVTGLDFTQPLLLVSVRVYVAVTVGVTVGFAEVEVKPDGELVHA